MAQRYLLPCDNCDQKIAIVTTQAGQTVRCSGCKQQVKVGTLRDVKALASADLSQGERREKAPKKVMGVGARLVFVASALLLVSGAIWGVSSLIKAKELETKNYKLGLSDSEINNLRNSLKAAKPMDMMRTWLKVDEESVAEWVEHPSIKNRKQTNERRLYSYIGFGIAGLGLLGIFGSTIFGSKNVS